MVDVPLFDPLSVAGRLALLLGGLASVLAGALLLRRASIGGKPRRPLRAASVALTGTLLVAAAVTAVEDSALDLNPAISPGDLTGIWRHGGATLRLEPNGQYVCAPRAACSAVGELGEWRHYGDFDIELQPRTGQAIVHRIIEFGGRRRFTRMERGIDLWSRDLTFKQVAPAS